MMCPSCGSKGKMEQIGFSPESEHYYCHTCHVTYVAYAIGNGELTEPVPLTTAQHHSKHRYGNDSNLF